MPNAFFALTALTTTVLVGAGLSAWLWWVRCPRLVVEGGIRVLAAMRWREFSRFVIEALQAQGFEATRIEPGQHQAPEADLRLSRDNQNWLLNCKQGANSRITVAMVAELARSVRLSSADGGVLATLGQIDPEARRQNQGLELLDGATLWPLIDPLLPPSLHSELAQKARADTLRSIGLAWLIALAVGIVAAMAVVPWLADDPAPVPASSAPASPAPAAAPPAASRAPGDAATPEAAAPLSEDEMRLAVTTAISALPGVEDASWVTRSTLLVQLPGEAGDALVESVCAVLERHEPLRTSRVQLQAPPESGTPVRFMQCRTY